MQSSAKRQIDEQISVSISLINNKNIRGPKTVPCGTPDSILYLCEISEEISCNCPWVPYIETKKCYKINTQQTSFCGYFHAIPVGNFKETYHMILCTAIEQGLYSSWAHEDYWGILTITCLAYRSVWTIVVSFNYCIAPWCKLHS